MMEIYETEEKYVKDLKLIITVFMEPFGVSGLLDYEMVSSVFSNVETLSDIHSQLFSKLKNCIDEENVLKIGDMIECFAAAVV